MQRASLLQQFCRDVDLPDLSPLVREDLSTSERCTVMWEVMQRVLYPYERRDFLREFCNHSAAMPALKMLATLIVGDIDDQQCNNTFGIIRTIGGVDDVLCERMLAYFRQKDDVQVAEILEKGGLEAVAYNLEGVFTLSDDESVLVALDSLKFEANPERFATELDTKIRGDEAIMTSKMGVLDLSIERLNAEKQALELELAGLSPVLSNPPSGGATATATTGTISSPSVPGPNGFFYKRMRRGV